MEHSNDKSCDNCARRKTIFYYYTYIHINQPIEDYATVNTVFLLVKVCPMLRADPMIHR